MRTIQRIWERAGGLMRRAISAEPSREQDPQVGTILSNLPDEFECRDADGTTYTIRRRDGSGSSASRPPHDGLILSIGGERRIDLLEPEIDEEDVLRMLDNLAKLPRWNGWTVKCDGLYSVAHHSLAVADLLRVRGYGPDVQLGGLLHDLAESIISDIAAPLRDRMTVEGVGTVDEIESRILDAVYRAIDIDPPYFRRPADAFAVEEADEDVTNAEAIRLVGAGWVADPFLGRPADALDALRVVDMSKRTCVPPGENRYAIEFGIKTKVRDRFEELLDAVRGG